MSGPILRGLRLVRGSGLLIGFRLAATTLPAFVVYSAAQTSLGEGPARASYFAAIEGRMNADELLYWLVSMPGSIFGAISFALLVAFVLQLLAWAAAIDRLDRPESRASLFRDSGVHFGPFCRIALAAIIAAAVAALLLRAGTERLVIAGERAGWSGYRVQLVLPLISGTLGLLIVHLIGAWSLAAKVLTVIDRRKIVRRTLWIALKLLWRAPIRGGLFFVVVTLLATAIEGAVLAGWRNSDPRGAMLGGFVLLWLSAAIVSAIAWHWTVHAAVRLYRDSPLRETADAPLGIRGFFTRRR